MPIPALIGAGAALAAGGMAAAGGAQTRKMQIQLAREQMDFQERMSSTAWQRAVKDMRLAGINPMLAFMQGGASTPGGAQPSLQDYVGPAVSSAMHAKRLTHELKQMQENRELTEIQQMTERMRASQERTRASAMGATTEIGGKSNYQKMMEAEIRSMQISNQRDKYMLPGASVRGSKGAAWAELISKMLLGGAAMTGATGAAARGFKYRGPSAVTNIYGGRR